ncbi:MAG TPA: hypothetical protein VKA44_04635, partial [Gemmatimonadota bacterium]|nr:hypothetical protein [Gemmatimonadota bacterium]
WAFEITPQGVRRSPEPEGAPTPERERRAVHLLAGTLAALLVLAAGWGAWALWLRSQEPSPAGAADAANPAGVAVLYLDDLSPDHDLGYLASGLTEELIHRLNGVEGLSVASVNAVKPFRDREISSDSVGRELRVPMVIGGSVQRSGSRIRVTVQLLDAASGTTLQSTQVEAPRGELFQLEDQVADSVARVIRTRMGIEIRQLRDRTETRSVRAWTLVQQAHGLEDDAAALVASGDSGAARRTLLQADALLAQAGVADPRWPRIPVERGWAARRLATTMRDPAAADVTWLRRALADADHALALDTGRASARELRGTVLYDLGVASRGAQADSYLVRAERDLRAATMADPTRARAWATLSDLYRTEDRRAESDVAARHALRADAFLENGADILASLVANALQREDPTVALALAGDGRRRYVGDARFPSLALQAYAGSDAATVAVDTAWRLLGEVEGVKESGPAAPERLLVAAILVRHGRVDSARNVVRSTRRMGAAGPASDRYEAHVLLLLDERSQALTRLASYVQAAPDRREALAGDPWFRVLHGDPRFVRLLGGTGTPGAR